MGERISLWPAFHLLMAGVPSPYDRHSSLRPQLRPGPCEGASVSDGRTNHLMTGIPHSARSCRDQVAVLPTYRSVGRMTTPFDHHS